MKILQRTIHTKSGKHCARIPFKDDNGKIHEIMRTAESKSAAKTRLAQLEIEILEKETARLEAGKVTFRQLAEYVKTRFYVPATYSEDGCKVSGVRSVKAAHYAIDKLVKYFGDKDIRKIDDSVVRATDATKYNCTTTQPKPKTHVWCQSDREVNQPVTLSRLG